MHHPVFAPLSGDRFVGVGRNSLRHKGLRRWPELAGNKGERGRKLQGCQEGRERANEEGLLCRQNGQQSPA